MMIAAPVALMALFMSETLPSRVLYLRQKKEGIEIRRQNDNTRLLLRKLQTACVRSFHMMFMEVGVIVTNPIDFYQAEPSKQPLVACLSIYTAFAFAMMFSFFGSYNFVFQSVYHFDQKSIGLTFIGILVGFLFGIASFGLFDATLYQRAVAKTNGKPAPEHRLYASMLGSFMLPIELFWFAWSPHKDVHWIVPVLAGVPFGWGCLSIFISAITYLVDVYHSANGASAVAANGMLRYGLGAAFPLFTLQMYDALGIHWAGSVFGFVGVLLMPMPWIFYFKGKVLRARSHYETSDY